jgi:hypothetical protein
VKLTASGATSYVWSGNGGNSASVTVNPIIDLPTTYTVTGTNASGCSKTAEVTVQVNKCTGLKDNGSAAVNVDIYPNPSGGVFNINKVSKGSVVQVFNALGVLVKTQTLDTDANKVDLTKESNGVYFMVILENNKTVYSQRVIKE